MNDRLRWGLLVAHLAALWPVGTWYARRLTHGAGEPWGLLAMAAAVVLVVAAPRRAASTPRLTLSTGFLVVFGVLWAVAPPLIAAAFAALSLAALVSDWRYGMRLQPALAGLLVLALPDISTLQFFIGWPFRVGVGAVVSPILSVLGLDVARQGTSLVVDGHALAIDAPCSGVWMGWGAFVLWLVLGLARRLSWQRLATGAALLVPIVFFANVFRTTSLVLLETSAILPAWAHEGIGVLIFALAACAVVGLSERRDACAPSPFI